MAEVDYQLVTSLPDETWEAVVSVLKSYNRDRNPSFYAARDLPGNAPEPLHVVAFDADEAVVGGLIGETQFAWLKVSIVAVAEHARRCGVGRRLMELAEQEAVARGCRHVFLDTMDYQAPAFYQKLGYTVAAKIDDWDSHGHARYYFIKELGQR